MFPIWTSGDFRNKEFRFTEVTSGSRRKPPFFAGSLFPEVSLRKFPEVPEVASETRRKPPFFAGGCRNRKSTPYGGGLQTPPLREIGA